MFVHERWLIILEINSDLDSSFDDFSEYLLSSDAVNKKKSNLEVIFPLAFFFTDN